MKYFFKGDRLVDWYLANRIVNRYSTTDCYMHAYICRSKEILEIPHNSNEGNFPIVVKYWQRILPSRLLGVMKYKTIILRIIKEIFPPQ